MDPRFLTYSLVVLLAGLGLCSQETDANGTVAKFVKDAISKDSVVIFSKSYCPHSKKTKEVFIKMKQPFTAYELDEREDGSLIQDELAKLTGGRTVPRVFINGEFVGGSRAIQTMNDNGKLQKVLTPAASAN